jgi:hypothetical protein
MDEKISIQAVEAYSTAYASKIADQFFSRKDRISGPEMLSLCEIQQVNLFVIRELLYAWKAEREKLKSPYFDYQDKDVLEALDQFQNTLSNHLSVAKADFLPLLEKAVSQTLYIVLDPYDFYSEALDRQGKAELRVSELKSDIKYLKINRAPLERLVQKLEQKKITTIGGNEAFAALDAILEEVGFTPEDIDGYLNQLSGVVPLELEKLYDAKGVVKTVTEVKGTPARPSGAEMKKPPIGRAEPPPAATPLAKPTKTLSENFQRVNRIKDSLTINQKFMFTKILFHGDFEIFSGTIDRLDTLDSLTQARAYLETTYPEWDREGEEFLEFFELVEKRFA